MKVIGAIGVYNPYIASTSSYAYRNMFRAREIG